MPQYNSVFGKWIPAEEYVVDPRAPEGQEIYKGPDRAALLELKAAGVEYFGEDYHLNPDTIRAARQLGYKTVDEYLSEMFGFNKEEQTKHFEKLKKVVNKHQNKERKAGVKELGGAYDTTGNEAPRYGDMGTPPELTGKIKA